MEIGVSGTCARRCSLRGGGCFEGGCAVAEVRGQAGGAGCWVVAGGVGAVEADAHLVGSGVAVGEAEEGRVGKEET